MKNRTIILPLLGASALAMAGGANAAMAGDRATIEAELESLQARLAALEAKRRVAPAVSMETGVKPRSWKLPGTNTSMAVGGYVKLDLIYDVNAFNGDNSGTAPPATGSAAGNRQGNFRLHARQSRFYVKTWTPTEWGELATHIEGDFFGGGGNQLISNSNALRLRHAYGRLGPVLAGQTWSTFMILQSLPDTLDFAGPVSRIFIRQGQIRYSHRFGGGTVLMLAIENPETGFVTSPAGLPLAGALGPSTDRLPDFILKLAHTYSNGYVALGALFRQLNVDDGGTAGLSSSTFGWGVHLGGNVQFNKKRTRFGGHIYAGQGIGRYSQATPNSSILNGTSSATQSLKAVTAVGGAIWVQHWWTDTLRSNVSYSRTFADLAAANTTGAGGKTGLGALVRDAWRVHANLIWRPVPMVDIGVEYIYGFAGIINSANGTAHRIQMSFKYTF